MSKQFLNKTLKPASDNSGSVNILRDKLIAKLLDKKFGKSGKKITKDDCDSCGEKCFD